MSISGPPSVTHDLISQTQVRLTVHRPLDDGGEDPIYYHAWLLADPWVSPFEPGAVIVGEWEAPPPPFDLQFPTNGPFSGLTPGATYHYVARSYNSSGWSDLSPALGFIAIVAPHALGISVDTITETSARIVVTAPSNNGGQAIDVYEAYVLSNNEYPYEGGIIVDSAQGGTFTTYLLEPHKTYHYTARAHNANGGWSPWTTMHYFAALAYTYVRVSGAWVPSLWYVKVSGVWLPGNIYAKVSGEWLE